MIDPNFRFFWSADTVWYPIGSSLPQNNFLASAWTLLNGKIGVDRKEKLEKIKLKKEQYIDMLFADSGMLSALINHCPQWADNQPYIVEQLNYLKPSVISHVDIPMSQEILEANHMNSEQALEKTIRNATQMLDLKTEAKKCFVVQGWTKEQYTRCIAAYKDLGILNGDHWVGLGTTVVRDPPNLYTIYDHCISEIRKINSTQHIHAFGISAYERLIELSRMGISSGDSAALTIKSFMGNIILGDERQVNIAINPANQKIYNAIYVINAWSWWTLYQKGLSQKKTSLNQFML